MKLSFIKLFLKLRRFRFFKNNFPSIVGVPVIITNSKNQILLGKRNSNMYAYPGYWGLVGGMVNQNESLREAAIREVKEEIGVDVKLTKQSKNLYEIFPDKNNPVQSLNIVFHAKITKGTPKALSETQDVAWFNLKNIKKMKLAYKHEEILEKEGLFN